ncbi:MAG: hypothetical protein KDN19_07625, partial [Verrucomicrobiae bacterium]|nr:hypothetical protein [Verrucomicrobiae bacterium]
FRPQDDASVRLEVTRATGDRAAAVEDTPTAEGNDGKRGKKEKGESKETEKKSEIFAEPSLEDAGLFEAAFYPPESGGYRAKAIVRDGEGNLLGEKETGWALNPAAEEFSQLSPNRSLLETLAEATGGRVLSLDEVTDFVDSLENLEVPVTETWTRPLWHAPWVFLLALVCFAGEWALRRWKGVL